LCWAIQPPKSIRKRCELISLSDGQGLVGPVEPVNVPVVLALGVAPLNGPQEVDGPIIQVDHQEMEDVPPPDAQPVGQNNHFLTMWR
jgi:hypothetical protein